MKKISFIICLLASFFISKSQTVIQASPDSINDICTTVTQEAEFPNGKTGWNKYIKENLDINTLVKNGVRAGTMRCW